MNIRLIPVSLLFLFSTLASAAEPVGTVLFVLGDNKIVGTNGTERTAKQGDVILPGERLLTRENSVAQVRLQDGTRVGVRPESDLKLGELPKDKTPVDVEKLTLSKGTVRVLSDENDKKPQKPLTLETPTSQMRLGKGDTETVYVPVDGKKPAGEQGGFHRLLSGKAELVLDQNRTMALKPLEVAALPELNKPIVIDALPKGTVDFSPTNTLAARTPVATTTTLAVKSPEVVLTPIRLPDAIAPVAIKTPDPIIAPVRMPTPVVVPVVMAPPPVLIPVKPVIIPVRPVIKCGRKIC